jgi:hypothetical protein
MVDDAVWFPPSDWVILTEVGNWLTKRFGEPPLSEWLSEMFSALRQEKPQVRYRVQGLDHNSVVWGTSWNPGLIVDPPGLKFVSGPKSDVVVVDLGQASFDPVTGTVAGRQKGEARMRHPLELHWPSVESQMTLKFACNRSRRRNASHVTAEEAKAPHLLRQRDDEGAKSTEAKSQVHSAKNADPFSELPAEPAERIRRQREEYRAWENDPANNDEVEFWLEAPFRKSKLEAMKVLTQNVAAPDAVALAVRHRMLFHIDEAIDALPNDEKEVRSAPPRERQATIERVRKRWKELDKRVACVGPEGLSLVPAGVVSQSTAAENVRDRNGVGVERARGERKSRRADTHKGERNQSGPRLKGRSSDDGRSQMLERRIERWMERMRRSREWISFADIADWCAREKGSIRADDNLKAGAYRALGESVMSGEFEERGRSRVVYQAALLVPSHPVRIRMTRELYEACPEPKRDNLAWCWVPRDLACRWLEGKRVALPPWLAGFAIVPISVKTDTPGVAKLAPSGPRKGKSRGPRPEKRSAIVQRMVSDFANDPEALDDEKQITLETRYGAARSTVEKARREALDQLRRNSDK